jgi:hypothetical protein
MRHISRFGAETALTIGGAATSLVAAYANYLLADSAGIDVSSWMYWFVLPAGAGIVGAVAASGYYITSLWTQCPATPLLAMNMVLIGLSTYALIQYLTYHALKFPGWNVDRRPGAILVLLPVQDRTYVSSTGARRQINR